MLVAGTATFRGGPDAYADNIRGLQGVSLLERVESETGEGEIEPGKRLIRVGDDRGLSLFERLNYRLHRFAWRTPLHALRLRGRVPLKLIAVPKDPIAGDKAAGEALLAGRFRHNGTEVAVAGLDFATIGLPERLHRLSAKLRLAARPLRRGDPRARRQARRRDHPQMARRLRRADRRARLARRSVGPAHPVLDRLCALHPLQRRPGLPLEPALRARPRRAPSRAKRRQGAARPAPDHRLERRDRRRSGRPGRPGAAEIGRGGPGARARPVAARRWRPRQPLADRADRCWSSCSASSAPSMRPAAATCPTGWRKRLAVGGRRPALGDARRRGAVELAGRPHGRAAAAIAAAAEGAGMRGRPAPPGARLGLSARSRPRPACSSSTPRRRRRRGRSTAPAPRPSPSSSATGRTG